MKRFAARLGIGMAAAALVAAATLSPSAAQNMYAVNPGTALSPTVKMQTKAKFVQGAFIMFEHASLKISTLSHLIDENHTLTTQASVRVKGLPGETVVMTCNIESRKGENYADQHNVARRDCDGSAKTKSRSIMSGGRVDNDILLTSDLLPDPSGDVASAISIEVTYI